MSTSSNATAPDVTSCAVNIHFVVPGLFDEGQFAHRSQTAHRVLSAHILVLVCIWALYVNENLSLRTSFVCSGTVQVMMGGYLLTWVLLLLSPEHAADGLLHDYVFRDIVQVTHARSFFWQSPQLGGQA